MTGLVRSSVPQDGRSDSCEVPKEEEMGQCEVPVSLGAKSVGRTRAVLKSLGVLSKEVSYWRLCLPLAPKASGESPVRAYVNATASIPLSVCSPNQERARERRRTGLRKWTEIRYDGNSGEEVNRRPLLALVTSSLPLLMHSLQRTRECPLNRTDG